MFGLAGRRILAYNKPVDMRKSINGLLGVINQVFEEDPLSDTLFVFVNRRCNYLKAIYWDRTGFCLFAKRLERGRFKLPGGMERLELSEKVLRLILDGIELGPRRKMR